MTRANTISSNSAGGKRWVVSKTVQIDGKPACWCIPVEVETGKEVKVTLDKDNMFDLRAAYDKAMKEPADETP